MNKLYRLYMDDSGNVDAATTNDPNQRYGSITAVLMEASYLDEKFNPGFQSLVKKHFGLNEDGSHRTLHRRQIATPQLKGPFSVLRDPEKRTAWDRDASLMFRNANYKVISACVDKVAWYWKYPNWSVDFYEVLVQCVLERAFLFLQSQSGISEVYIETKNEGRDKKLKEHYRLSLERGFQHIKGQDLRATFSSKELHILTKKNCKPGMQLADLLAAPALQHIRYIETGRHPVQGAFVKDVCEILEREKFHRRPNGDPSGWGRVWRPK